MYNENHINSKKSCAMKYYAYGWSIIPLHTVEKGACSCDDGTDCKKPGKHPRINWKNTDCTSASIDEWWTKWPDANIGILTGAKSGIIVIDVDPRHEGDKYLAGIEESNDVLPDTVRSWTGGGGEHIFFKYSEDVSTLSNKVGFLPGLDLRTEGGYIVAPGSNHLNGQYEWQKGYSPDDVTLAPMPNWLIDLASESSQPRMLDDGSDRITEGSRNDALFRHGISLLKNGCNKLEIADSVKSHNNERCQPPLPEAEVDTIIRSVLSYQRDSQKRNSPRTRYQWLDACHDLVLIRTPTDQKYVYIADTGETINIKNEYFSEWFVYRYHQYYDSMPKSEVIANLPRNLFALRYSDVKKTEVNVRIGGDHENTYHFLNNDDKDIIHISKQGYRLGMPGNTFFRESQGSLALPLSAEGRGLRDLMTLLHIEPDTENYVLLISWLLAALRPKGPYPLLVLQGEQGSAKSTVSRMLKNLVDPTAGGLLALPRNERDFVIQASNKWVLAYDNITKVSEWQSNALCRLLTGGGFETRKLYTDKELEIFDIERPVILNGIDEFVTKGDLLDRSIIVSLPPIAHNLRKTRQELDTEFERLRPHILHELYNIMACGYSCIDDVHETYPRMADFYKWIIACEKSGFWECGRFARAYNDNYDRACSISNEDPLCTSIAQVIENHHDGTWEGTATELLEELNRHVDVGITSARGWPQGAQALSRRINTIAPVLRNYGYKFEKEHRGKEGRRIIISSIKEIANDDAAISTSTGESNVVCEEADYTAFSDDAVLSSDYSASDDTSADTGNIEDIWHL